MIRTRSLASVALTLVVVLAAVSAPVAAQSDDDFWGDLTADEEPGLGVQAGAWLADQTSGLARTIASLGDMVGEDEGQTASVYADDFRETFNANNRTLEAYANQRVTATTDYDVYNVTFQDKDGGAATVYVVATVQDGNFTQAEALTPSEFEARNRTVDHTITADWYVSRNAAAELEAFVVEYAEPNDDVSPTYAAQKKATYGSGLNSTLWGGA